MTPYERIAMLRARIAKGRARGGNPVICGPLRRRVPVDGGPLGFMVLTSAPVEPMIET